MDRITRAMDTAEAEIDAAMNRTGEFLQLTEHRLHSEVCSRHFWSCDSDVAFNLRQRSQWLLMSSGAVL